MYLAMAYGMFAATMLYARVAIVTVRSPRYSRTDKGLIIAGMFAAIVSVLCFIVAAIVAQQEGNATMGIFDVIAYTIGALIIAAFIAAFIACPMPRINRDMFVDDNDETFQGLSPMRNVENISAQAPRQNQSGFQQESIGTE